MNTSRMQGLTLGAITVALVLAMKHKQNLNNTEAGNQPDFRKSVMPNIIPVPKKNAAYVFIKPHANNFDTQRAVHDQLLANGLDITTEGEFTGEHIDQGMLIDQVKGCLYLLLKRSQFRTYIFFSANFVFLF